MIKTQEIYTFQDPFIAAASGLVLVQNRFYLVADDELCILGINQDLKSSGEIFIVFPGELPEDKKERKKLKPDFECLVYLEEQRSLLCLPSGSKKNRNRGALLNLETKAVSELYFKKVYKALEELYTELNIEGGIILGDNIRLFQRGNGSLHQNAIIDLNLRKLLQDEVQDLKAIDIKLGKLKSIPLSITDATLFNDRIFFTAVAEDSESTFEDGEFSGAILGEMSMDGKILKTAPLAISSKPEGIAFDDNFFYTVTDDDDRKKPSRLFRCSVDQLSFLINKA